VRHHCSEPPSSRHFVDSGYYNVIGLALDEQQRLYALTFCDGIRIYSTDGAFQGTAIDVPGATGDCGNGITRDADGNTYVAQGARNQIAKFNSSGQFAGSFTAPSFNYVTSVFYSPEDDLLYVGNESDDGLTILTTEGVLVDSVHLGGRVIGTPGVLRQSAVAEITFDPPTGANLAPPTNLAARITGISRRASISAASQPREAQAPGGITGYKVYRSNQPNVNPSPNSIFATLPPNQTSTAAAIPPGGAYFVVTACYGDTESAPSNEASAGTPGASISSLRVKPTKIVAKGTGFTPSVQVFLNGVPFVGPARVKQRRKVSQAGLLTSGESIAQVFAAGTPVEVTFLNSDQSLTRVTVAP
jgi:hypothetical protein